MCLFRFVCQLDVQEHNSHYLQVAVGVAVQKQGHCGARLLIDDIQQFTRARSLGSLLGNFGASVDPLQSPAEPSQRPAQTSKDSSKKQIPSKNLSDSDGDPLTPSNTMQVAIQVPETLLFW